MSQAVDSQNRHQPHRDCLMFCNGKKKIEETENYLRKCNKMSAVSKKCAVYAKNERKMEEVWDQHAFEAIK